ncbi:MAG: hypothetical protein QXS79_06760 [Candidatus Bathyarchaeia archaeon]
MSDKLIGELKLALEDVVRGLWRFKWNSKERVRYSEPPEYWEQINQDFKVNFTWKQSKST